MGIRHYKVEHPPTSRQVRDRVAEALESPSAQPKKALVSLILRAADVYPQPKELDEISFYVRHTDHSSDGAAHVLGDTLRQPPSTVDLRISEAPQEQATIDITEPETK